MRIRFFLAVTAIVLLMSCPHDRQLRAEPAPTPTPGSAPGAVAPDATETALPTVTCPSTDLHLPAPRPGDTAIEPATYTICDVGDPADDHMRKGVTPSGKLLDVGDRVTICELDEVMRLKFTYKNSPERAFDAAAFIVDGKARQLKALDSLEHPKGYKSPERHLVKITRNNENYEPPRHEGADRCDKEKHQIIRIQFCYFYSNKWRCPGEGPGASGAHQGDIHGQN